MKKLILISALLFCLTSYSQGREVVWITKEFDNKIWLSVDGITTHGDQLRIMIPSEDCSIGNTRTTFLTVTKHPDVLDIKDQVVSARFRDMDIKVKIDYVIHQNLINGDFAFVNIGWNKLEEIKRFFEGYDRVTLELLDDDLFKPSDYLDISENTWAINGLNTNLDQAIVECEALK